MIMPKDKEQRLPPQSIESEVAVLGCILINPKSFDKAAHYINKDSFSDSKFRPYGVRVD